MPQGAPPSTIQRQKTLSKSGRQFIAGRTRRDSDLDQANSNTNATTYLVSHTDCGETATTRLRRIRMAIRNCLPGQ